MQDQYRPNRRPGATLQYTVFLCVASVLFVTGIAYVGNQYSPQITAWHQGVEIDTTAVGSITQEPPIKIDNSITKIETGPDNIKTYRVYQLPKGLIAEE